MDGFDRALVSLKERRDRVLSGKINCIPLPFNRFRAWFPGTEKGKYYLISANQKIGKSKLADYLFVYEPLFYVMEHPDQCRLKVLYFTLEMSPQEKYYEFLCHLLFRLDGIRLGSIDLKSTNKDKPLPEKILELFETEKYKKYINAYKDMVTYITDIKNPTGIYKYCRGYALEHGKLHYTKSTWRNPDTGELEDKQKIDYYEPEDPEEYRFIVIDNTSNIMPEKGMDLMSTITKASKYNIDLRDYYGFSPVMIQHQNQAQEGIENIKLDKMKPSANGLADCKTTIRDINTAIGIYSPFKFGLKEYEQYDITKLRNNVRFMEIIEDRDGAGGMICPLLFDGAISAFTELPLATDKENMKLVYNYLDSIRNNTSSMSMFSYSPINKYAKLKRKLRFR